MAKPILLVALPYGAAYNVEKIQKKLEKRLTDYHVIAYLHNKEDIEFKVVCEIVINFEDLKDFIRISVLS